MERLARLRAYHTSQQRQTDALDERKEAAVARGCFKRSVELVDGFTATVTRIAVTVVATGL